MTRGDIVLAVAPPALWALTYTIAKPVTQSFPPMFLMSIAYALTAVALFRPWSDLKTSHWALLAAATLGASVQSALIFSGIALVPASTAVLVVQSQVPFAVLAAWVIGQERMNVRRLVGIAMAISGVALIVGLPESIGDIKGLLLIVSGTLCWGIAQGIIRASSRDPGSRLMGAMSAIAAPQLLLMSALMETGQRQAIGNATIIDWAGVVVLAFGGFVAAYTIWHGLLRRNRVDEVAPFALLMPVFGLIAAFLLLGERPSLFVFGGAAIILTGLGLVAGISGRSLGRAPP